MYTTGVHQKIYRTLQIAVAMCFIGHGTFGIITKAIWCNYFAVFGIDQQLSYQLMPFLGGIDILLGIMILVYPNRFVPAWLVIWGFVTALLRPLSGEHVAEFIERAGNYGAPLALLLLIGIPRRLKDLTGRIHPNFTPSEKQIRNLYLCLKIAGFLLLAGHGWLNLSMKKGLLLQYSSLGISNVALMAKLVGITEIAGGLLILIKPFRELVLIFFLWKMLSESFYPNYPLFEWIERGGSYGTLLALWFLTKQTLFSPAKKNSHPTVELSVRQGTI